MVDYPAPDATPVPQKKFNGPEWFLLVSTLILIALTILITLRPDLIQRIDHWMNGWQDLAVRHGLLGVFLAMVIGNLTIVVILPTTVVPFLVAASGVDPFLVALASGIGAEIGELSGYVIGRWGSKYLQRKEPKAYELVRGIVEHRPRAVPLLLYTFSALPLPDDILFIPLGLIRYRFWKLFWPSVLGKITAGIFIGWGGALTKSVVESTTVTFGQMLTQIGLLFGLVLFMYILFKVPWHGVLKKFAPPHLR